MLNKDFPGHDYPVDAVLWPWWELVYVELTESLEYVLFGVLIRVQDSAVNLVENVH